MYFLVCFSLEVLGRVRLRMYFGKMCYRSQDKLVSCNDELSKFPLSRVRATDASAAAIREAKHIEES